jgi:hypothetical protein
VAILDVRNSFSVAFLAILDQNTTFIFFSGNGRLVSILDVQNSFSFAFLAISDQNATFIFFQNGRRRPFWMSEIHFRLRFSKFLKLFGKLKDYDLL